MRRAQHKPTRLSLKRIIISSLGLQFHLSEVRLLCNIDMCPVHKELLRIGVNIRFSSQSHMRGKYEMVKDLGAKH